ncbi:MAG TPA: glycosyltransferase family 39 protein [Thermoanaerobaculia bacterium]|nr:glycosyltransferase family 39 protein [Thermoanaerobaculia bacterium]
MSRRAAAAAALGLTALALLAVRGHTRRDALSADEPIHILSGYLEVFGRTAIVNIEHPPLMKALAGFGLTTLGLPPPPAHIPLGQQFTPFGHVFLFENRVSADAIAAAARAPFLAVFAALLLLVFFAARSRHGEGAALFALSLCALDPNLVAHAGVVHTDLGAALAFLATVLAWDGAWRRPSAGRVAAAGAVLGLALVTKFSCIYLVPILLLQALVGSRGQDRPGRAAARSLAAWAGALVVAVAVVLGVYAAVTSRMDRGEQRQVIHEMVAGRGAPRLSAAIEGLVDVSPPLAHYVGGLAAVARQNAVGGGVNFLAGRVSAEGFPFYFFAAFLAKSSIAFLLVTALLGVGLIVGGRPAREDGALFLLPAGVLFLASIGTTYNIGIRHLLPVYPLIAMAAAGLFDRVRRATVPLARPALLALCALPVVAAGELARIHPYELSYFNPFAGGPEKGRALLSDSNVDWGLDLARLGDELERRGVSNPTVVYFGGDDVAYRTGVADFAAEPVVRGRLVAISAFHLALGPEYYRYHGAMDVARSLEALREDLAARGRPAGRVGYSIYLFELPEGGGPP